MADIDRDYLIAKIERAFKSSEHPKSHIGDIEEVGHLRYKTWQEASIHDLKRVDSLIFFSVEGFYYFLPAYLIATLRDPNQLGVMMTLNLFYALHHFSPPTLTQKHRLALFSKQKTAAIIEFLEVMQATDFTAEPFRYMQQSRSQAHEHLQYTLQDWLAYAKKRS